MAWLATLDAKARRWPAAFRWPYVGLKWLLIAVGLWAALGAAYIEVVEEHRVGLGSGIAVACIFALVKGVIMAARPSARSPETHRQL